jgi:hypothetical protein
MYIHDNINIILNSEALLCERRKKMKGGLNICGNV